MKKTCILLVLFIASHSFVSAQQGKIDTLKMSLNKHSINLSYGILSASLSYESLYQGKVFGSKNSTIVDYGLGGLAHWDGASPFINSRFGILTGSGRRHFEAKLGACFFFAGDMENMLLPSGSIGYRKQKPGSHYIFRTGVGFPDALYVSWGVSF